MNNPPPLPSQTPIAKALTYSQTQRFEILDKSTEHVYLKFVKPSGRMHVLSIVHTKDALMFSIPAMGSEVSHENELPTSLNLMLLKLNAKFKIGYWSIGGVPGRIFYEIGHSIDPSLLSEGYFLRIVGHLVDECENFEQALSS